MAPQVSRNDAYLLDRSAAESVRLNSQHFLWSSHLGYVLHPSVPIRQNFRVADVGCGNAIWLLDLSQKLPPDARLDGFDLSDKQFPAERLRPANLYFSTLNLLETVPAELENAFDLVHVRVLASVFSPATIGRCLSNIRKMLKPGGYVQWEDADTIRQAVHGEAAYAFETAFNNVLQDAGIDWSWVPRLPSFLEAAGFAVLHVEQDVFDVPLKQLATTTFLLAVRQVIHGIRRALGESPASAATYKLEDMLNDLLDQHNSGLEYTWQPIYLLAQLPVGSDV